MARRSPDSELQATREAALPSAPCSAVVIADIVETVPLTMLGNLPCPFCGSTNLSRLRPKKEGNAAWIMCESCGATGPNQSVEVAEVWWNKRAFGSEIFIRPTDAERWLDDCTPHRVKQNTEH